MAGLLGTKVGMTRVIAENGDVTPVTLVSLADDNVVLRLLGEEGSQKIEVASFPYKRERKNKKYKQVVSFPLNEGEEFKAGDKLGLDLVQIGDKVTVVGTSKGKGFQGTMKRHNFGGFPKTHGHSHDRVPGSIGACSTPGRVFKGQKMSGRMGGDRKTLKNVEIVRIDDKNKLLAFRGALPGSRGSIVQMTIKVSTSEADKE